MVLIGCSRKALLNGDTHFPSTSLGHVESSHHVGRFKKPSLRNATQNGLCNRPARSAPHSRLVANRLSSNRLHPRSTVEVLTVALSRPLSLRP
jgi:hypothetical protein